VGVLLDDLDALCRERRAVALKLEPDVFAGAVPDGFQPARTTVQPPRTIVIDLKGTEDRLLERMKQKTRYNVRLGQRKGVVVRQSGDLDTFNTLIAETGERDMFGVHSPDYYRRVYEIFHPRDMCELLVAEAGGGSSSAGVPLAALMVFARGARAWYLYGASSNEFRNFMPTYVLQWEAMRWARGQGCTEYDLWGVPDEDEETLEAEFTKRADGLWGVYRFKRGFGGEVRRGAGPWERVYRPVLHRVMDYWTTR
jgi:lipid II:glycine glycyltransferase (peptidoglycan interpeptide bridge formation enzyme)